MAQSCTKPKLVAGGSGELTAGGRGSDGSASQRGASSRRLRALNVRLLRRSGVLRVTVREHPTVRVDKRDLLLDLPITPMEALAGAEVTAPTFEGAVKLKIPPGSQSGRKLRLRGRGLPALKTSTGAPRGDLYVVLQIVLPPDSPQTREAAASLQKLYKSDLRKDVVL